MNHTNIRISGVPNIYLTQKLLREWTFKPSWWTDYLIGWNIMCVLVFAYALFTFLLHVLIFKQVVFETLIYSMENTRDICKNYTRECFNHFCKIKIHELVKNHLWNFKKTQIVIYCFQKYAQKNLFSSFSAMLKHGLDYVLSTTLNHGLI